LCDLKRLCYRVKSDFGIIQVITHSMWKSPYWSGFTDFAGEVY
jgi:hypothetical protein